MHLYGMEQDGDGIPSPTPVELIRTGDRQVLILVDAWMPLVRDAIESRAVKKTLTIPKWLDDMAIEQGINFSRTLQEALKHQLDIAHERR